MKNLILTLLVLMSATIFATTIYDIQYTTDPGTDGTYPSPLVDQEVTVTGIVTANNYYSSGNANRFFISDPVGGAWHGVFVFNFDATPNIGDEVEVTGTVSEYYGFTELGNVTVSILGEGNPVPDAAPVSTGDLASGEAYEGVLTRLSNVTVTQLPDNYGQWYVDDGSGECQIDDAIFSYSPVIGQTFGSITGAVDYSYDEYGLNPRSESDLVMTFAADNMIPASAELAGCFPNPYYAANSKVNISFAVKNNSFVTVEIYNLKGQRVKQLVSSQLSAGPYSVIWNGKDKNNVAVGSGIYLYKLKTDNVTLTKKMILMH